MKKRAEFFHGNFQTWLINNLGALENKLPVHFIPYWIKGLKNEKESTLLKNPLSSFSWSIVFGKPPFNMVLMTSNSHDKIVMDWKLNGIRGDSCSFQSKFFFWINHRKLLTTSLKNKPVLIGREEENWGFPTASQVAPRCWSRDLTLSNKQLTFVLLHGSSFYSIILYICWYFCFTPSNSLWMIKEKKSIRVLYLSFWLLEMTVVISMIG